MSVQRQQQRERGWPQMGADWAQILSSHSATDEHRCQSNASNSGREVGRRWPQIDRRFFHLIQPQMSTDVSPTPATAGERLAADGRGCFADFILNEPAV